MADNQAIGPGWYPDPSGAHQFRYFGTTWTDRVSNAGVVTISPPGQPTRGTLAGGPADPNAAGPPASAATYPGTVSTSPTPVRQPPTFVPPPPQASVYGPSADYAARPADGTPKRKRIAMLAVAIAAAVATTVGVLVATSGGDGSSFCSDYASLRGLENAADPSAGQKIAAMFRKLAAEGPPDAKADLTLLARDITAQVNGQSIDTAAEDAAVARADRIAERTCAHR